MQKSKIDKFIQKYNLGGNVNKVKWKSDGNSLSTDFVTDDRSLMGSVKLDESAIESAELGIYTTDQLQRLLSVLDDDTNVSLTKFDEKVVSLNVADTNNSITYQLSDLTVIGQTPKMKSIPHFETKINIDDKFMDVFCKGKTALPDSDSFTIVKNGKVSVVIGYATISTNRVCIPVTTTEEDLSENISFNANLFKDILVANKNCSSSVLEVSNAGLARISFKEDNYTSVYYLVAMQGNN